jgi:hypothetical protein
MTLTLEEVKKITMFGALIGSKQLALQLKEQIEENKIISVAEILVFLSSHIRHNTEDQKNHKDFIKEINEKV